jgi:small-conductance mechanosensitive channel
MAAGGVLAMVIGLAVQMNFSNLISCIAINVEQPYKIDDYIKILDYEGFVQKITWRSTMLNTGDSTIISVPNNMVSESVIVNYDYCDQAKQDRKDFNVIELIVHIKPYYPPKRVQKILMDAVLTSNTHIIQDGQEQILIFNSPTIPDPMVELKEITDKSVDYVITFHIRSMADKDTCLKAIWYRIWQHCYFAEIEFAFSELNRIENCRQNETFMCNEISEIRSSPTEQYLKGKQVNIAEEEKNKKYFIKEGVVKIQKNDLEILIGAGDSFSDISFFECISDSLIWPYSQTEECKPV